MWKLHVTNFKLFGLKVHTFAERSNIFSGTRSQFLMKLSLLYIEMLLALLKYLAFELFSEFYIFTVLCKT